MANHDLVKALQRALIEALQKTSKEYLEKYGADPYHSKAVERKVKELAQQIQTDFLDFFDTTSRESELLPFADGEDQGALYQKLADFIQTDKLQSHGPNLQPFLEERLPKAIELEFIEQLKDQQNTRPWVAYQRLLLTDIRQQVTQLPELTNRLETLIGQLAAVEQRQRSGQAGSTDISNFPEELKAFRADNIALLERFGAELQRQISDIVRNALEEKDRRDADRHEETHSKLDEIIKVVGEKKIEPSSIPWVRREVVYRPKPRFLRLLFRLLPGLDMRTDYFKVLENKLQGFDKKTVRENFQLYIAPVSPASVNKHKLAASISPKTIKETLRKINKDLLHLFLDGFFQKEHFYALVMGDAGTGKTTFLQKLFCDYARTYPSQSLAFIYSDEDMLAQIKAIPDKEHTLLFLDALDENAQARENLSDYLAQLSSLLIQFNKAVITCRVQLFKDRSEEWQHLTRQVSLDVIEIKEFSEKEAFRYLEKRYGKEPVRLAQAKSYFGRNKSFFKRPLILSWFDDLLQEDPSASADQPLPQFKYLFEIYERITGLWAEREEDRVEAELVQQRSYAQKLIQFSRELALFLYQHQQTAPQFQEETVRALASAYAIKPVDARSRSFLTRDRETDRFAFSHQSFQDYFLATQLFYGRIREEDFPFDQYPETARHFQDMCWLRHADEKKVPRLPTYEMADLAGDAGMRGLCGKPQAVMIPNRALRAMLYRHRETLRSWEGVHDWLGLVERLLPLCAGHPAAGHYIFQDYRQYQDVLEQGVLPDAPLSLYVEQFLAEHVFREVQKAFGKSDFWTAPHLHISAKEEDYLALLPAAYPQRDFGAVLGILARNPLFKERLGALEAITLNGLCLEDANFLRHCSFHLATLDLSRNALRQIPSALPSLGNLRKLHLDENRLQLERNGLRPVLELPELQSLSLFGNPTPADFSAPALGKCLGDNVLQLLRKQVLLPPPMIRIPGGTFDMGQPDPTIVTYYDGVTTLYSDDEQPVHPVTLSDFCLGKYAVTLGEFRTFIEETGHVTLAEEEDAGSYIWDSEKGTIALHPGINWRHDAHGKEQINDRHPVLHVSWYDAAAFCNWLSRREGLQEAYSIDPAQEDPDNASEKDTAKWLVTVNWNANGYRLPTEAEWEYAARERGKEVRFGNGKDIANSSEINLNGSAQYQTAYSIAGEYRGRTVPVGSLPPNALDLYEMSGNVNEWCWDWYARDYYANSPSSNPKGPSAGSNRVLRGGSWFNVPQYCRVARRDRSTPGNRGSDTGFRLARTF
jgi:formylglycine-generating enzyme required for sulfatase activity